MGDVYGNLKAYKLERRSAVSNAAGLVRTSRTILESETFPIKIQMWRRTQSKRLNESPNDFSAFSRDKTELLGLLSLSGYSVYIFRTHPTLQHSHLITEFIESERD